MVRRLKKIIKIIFVILCMCTIFFFSNDKANASTKKSDGIIIKISEVLLGKKLNNTEKKKYKNKYVVLVRKSAHFTIYLVLGLSFISLLKEYMIIDKRSIIYTIIFVFLYACSDEIHQYFVPGRSCEIRDVFIDTLGGIVGCYFYKLILNMRRKKYE